MAAPPPIGPPETSRSRLFARGRGRISGVEAAPRRRLFQDPPHLPEGSLYILPNLFTAASLFLALFAIVKVAEGEFVMACWLILGSAICDAIDGPVARLTKTSSSFGVQFDSLADLVAFGVAPAFLMYQNLRGFDETMLPGYAPRLALGACALFAIFSAVRLARFNVQADTVERQFFQGLPTPGAAGTVVATYLFIEWLSRLEFWAELETTRLLHRSILMLMLVLAVLMVSEIPFPKLKNLLSISRKPFNNLVLLTFIACLLISFLHMLPVVIFGAFVLYLACSVAMARRNLATVSARPAEVLAPLP
jgi:CDP-diacylglycerol--serine O-phosphatidyltransferase